MAEWNWWPRFHDPALRLSLREQAELHWDANVLMLRDWRACWSFTWISLIPAVLFVGAVRLAVVDDQGRALGSLSPTTQLALGLALVPLYLLLQHVAFSIAMKRTYIPFVRAALTARGHPTCIACGQLLGPATPAKCPECGSGTSDPR